MYETEFQALVEMIGYDMPEVIVDLLDTYLEESAGLVEVIRTEGRTDLSSQSLMRAAHSLKSSSASVGAMPLSVLCGDLENHLRGIGDAIDVEAQIVRIDNEYGRVSQDLAVRRETLLNT
ncbi:MAG: Hpt domain-containing protein [Litorilinea sp.]